MTLLHFTVEDTRSEREVASCTAISWSAGHALNLFTVLGYGPLGSMSGGLARGKQGHHGEGLLSGYRDFFWDNENSLELGSGISAQHRECTKHQRPVYFKMF